ncbi:MAG: imidazolonepropionase [Ardenticatenales bacterium]|nr:imidazolonepropionase [Ardenticatenales bacterium]
MPESIDMLIHAAAQVCVVPAPDGPQRGHALGTLGVIEDGAVAVHAGRIRETGDSATLRARYAAEMTIDAGGRCVLPGFVDPHTHIPWMGDRANEFEQRLAGATYMEIMAAGGGIMSTVRRTRAASLAELVADNLPRLRRMLAYGTTSAEAKTGYGLALEAELKQLAAMAALNQQQPVELSMTFLPAHAIPAEFHNNTDAYVTHVIEEMLPAAATWAAAQHVTLFCDVFCEQGVFDVPQTRRIFARAQELGFRLKVHADEFVGLGGTALAVEMGATSADHLVHTPAADIAALGSSNTVAVGLPGTPFGLAERDYTPAKAILAAGGALALATDYNPGTCWCESMQMVIALACRYMGLTQAQAIAAATVNAAYAIGRGEEIGSLEPGKQADILILNVPDYRQLGYRFGANLAQTVIKQGRVVVSNILDLSGS